MIFRLNYNLKKKTHSYFFVFSFQLEIFGFYKCVHSVSLSMYNITQCLYESICFNTSKRISVG